MPVTLGPLVLTPRLVQKPWGGRRLADLGRDLPADVRIGESWDVADLDPAATEVDDPVSRVAHGPYAGRSLGDLIGSHREELLGLVEPTADGRFPLLLKHLDARENLSVQVHPSAAVLDRLPGAQLKTESWVVVHAEPGAELMLGLQGGVLPDDFEAAFGTEAVVPMIRRVPARVGDVHHVPAGLLHALGAGVVVAEPQTPSDTTYRVYDWTQDYDRAPRPLHRDEAMLCLRAEWWVNLDPPAARRGDGLLVDTSHYRISRSTALLAGRTHVPQRDHPRVVVVVSGAMQHAELPHDLGPGGVVVLPARWGGSFDVTAGTVWLDVDLH